MRNWGERLFWIAATVLNFTFAALILRSAISDWIHSPGGFVISTFSLPATDLAYPAITTVCKAQKYDIGEYLRAVYDNFEFACEANDEECSQRAGLIRADFPALTEFTAVHGLAVSQQELMAL